MTNGKPIFLDRKFVEDFGDQHGVGTEADLFGLEIELEGIGVKTNKEPINKFWALHEDGSLRANKMGSQCCEYVFKKPLNMTSTTEALSVLYKYLKGPGVEVFDSYRTSIHVHVNCLQETNRTIVNFITLAIIFDELFVSQNGDTRIGNNFCLRSKDAEGQIADICNSINKYGSLFNLNANDRYSSTNFVSLLKFGTVEFRSLECTTDLERVIHWIKTLQALKVSAKMYENPKEIINKFSRKGPLGFLMAHLGDQYAKYAMVPGAHQMLQNGMRLAQDFAFCSDWKLADPNEKPKRAAKGLKAADMGFEQFVQAQAAAQQQLNVPAQQVYWNAAQNAWEYAQVPPAPPPPQPEAPIAVPVGWFNIGQGLPDDDF